MEYGEPWVGDDSEIHSSTQIDVFGDGRIVRPAFSINGHEADFLNRFKLCMNACAGVPDDMLYHGMVKNLLAENAALGLHVALLDERLSKTKETPQ